MMRKHILLQAAVGLGVPEESGMNLKKALQYGSSINEFIRKIERERSALHRKEL